MMVSVTGTPPELGRKEPGIAPEAARAALQEARHAARLLRAPFVGVKLAQERHAAIDEHGGGDVILRMARLGDARDWQAPTILHVGIEIHERPRIRKILGEGFELQARSGTSTAIERGRISQRPVAAAAGSSDTAIELFAPTSQPCARRRPRRPTGNDALRVQRRVRTVAGCDALAPSFGAVD